MVFRLERYSPIKFLFRLEPDLWKMITGDKESHAIAGTLAQIIREFYEKVLAALHIFHLRIPVDDKQDQRDFLNLAVSLKAANLGLRKEHLAPGNDSVN